MKSYFYKDIYVAVLPQRDVGPRTEQEDNSLTLSRGDSTIIGNREYAVKFVDYDIDIDTEVVPVDLGADRPRDCGARGNDPVSRRARRARSARSTSSPRTARPSLSRTR